MNVHVVSILGVAVLACQLHGDRAQGGDCVLDDDFSDTSGYWDLVAPTSGILNVTDQNGRLDYWSASSNNGAENIFAAAVSLDWTIDMTSDWAVQGRWHINPPTPIYGDVGVAFVVFLEGTIQNLYLERAYTLAGGVVNVGSGAGGHETTALWVDNERLQQTSFARAYTESTVYIWYNASSQVIYYDDELYGANAVGVSLAGLSSKTEALLAIAAYDYGYVSAFSTGLLWVDDFCIIDGVILGCLGDATNDGVVDVDDVLYVVSAWDTADANADFDQDGLVDTDDVLILLSHYGEGCP